MKILREIYVPDSCWTGQPVQGIGPSRCSFTHTNCTSHLNQGCSLWWETPGYKSWPRNLSWGLCQWLTSVHCEQHRALGQTSTFYLHFSLCLHFLFSSWLCPAFTARSPQQWFPLARETVRSTTESCSQLGPHRSTVIIIITDENPFPIFLNYRSGIQCPAHIPEQVIILPTEKCFVKKIILQFFF